MGDVHGLGARVSRGDHAWRGTSAEHWPSPRAASDDSTTHDALLRGWTCTRSSPPLFAPHKPTGHDPPSVILGCHPLPHPQRASWGRLFASSPLPHSPPHFIHPQPYQHAAPFSSFGARQQRPGGDGVRPACGRAIHARGTWCREEERREREGCIDDDERTSSRMQFFLVLRQPKPANSVSLSMQQACWQDVV